MSRYGRLEAAQLSSDLGAAIACDPAADDLDAVVSDARSCSHDVMLACHLALVAVVGHPFRAMNARSVAANSNFAEECFRIFLEDCALTKPMGW